MPSDGRIQVSPTGQLRLYLAELKRVGLFGKSRNEIINQLCGQRIVQLIESGVLRRLSQEQEANLAEAEAEDDQE